jgi:hypothetical protein
LAPWFELPALENRPEETAAWRNADEVIDGDAAHGDLQAIQTSLHKLDGNATLRFRNHLIES